MKYVLMKRNDIGEVCRAFGDDYLNQVFTFPDYDDDDEEMYAAFCTWANAVEEKANAIWRSIFGEEDTLFLEEDYGYKFRHMSLSELEAYAEAYLD